MTEEQIQQREQEMRNEHPEMFTHPGLRPGEIWFADKVVDMYPSHNHPSAGGNELLNQSMIGYARA
jgi:hypothetical protein